VRNYSIVFVVVVAALLGCGDGNELGLVPVSGNVTFGGGPCPHDGSVNFMQVQGTGLPGKPNRPGRGEFGTNGKFVATSFKKGDGLFPGRYEVTITCVSQDADASHPISEVSFVPMDYKPDDLVVEPGSGSISKDYDVPPKKK
jgi:hypothetical protein